ncbi:MAG: NAD(P)H-dependent glycerol-3-phosphate dehydrogenase [Kiloniellales bacterium]
MTIQHIAVVGAGAWGTALAFAAARAGRTVTLWARDAEAAAAMEAGRVNLNRLPEVTLPAGILVTGDSRRLAEADVWLLALPAQSLRGALQGLSGEARAGLPLVICAKGIERGSGLLLDRVVADVLPGRPLAVLSGPTFAIEVARNLPTAIALACRDRALGEALVSAIGSATFRPYYTADVTGALLGGATKNVIGLAAGIVAGRGYGENARASLLTRGLAEMSRLGRVLGAEAETLMGLAGLGDLILTGTSTQSRNYSHGLAIGRGVAPGLALAEGAASAAALLTLAAHNDLEVPIAAAVVAVLEGRSSIEEAVEGLLSRPFRDEAI